jgi:hypothetical protein
VTFADSIARREHSGLRRGPLLAFNLPGRRTRRRMNLASECDVVDGNLFCCLRGAVGAMAIAAITCFLFGGSTTSRPKSGFRYHAGS